jgi:hypothetical protein
VVALDITALMDALQIDQAVFGAFDPSLATDPPSVFSAAGPTTSPATWTSRCY